MQWVHEMTLLDGQNLIEGTRDVEAQRRDVFRALSAFAFGQLLNLFLRQIALVSGSEIEFVAVFILLHGAHDGLEGACAVVVGGARLGQLQMADACQLVVDLLLLEPQLFLVRQLLPLAASTDAEVLAARLSADGAQLAIPDHFCFGVAVFLATDLQVDDVAWHCPRYKHDELALRLSVVGRRGDSNERLAFGSHIGDGYVLEYREGFFLSCHDGS